MCDSKVRTTLGTTVPLSDFPITGASLGISGILKDLVQNDDGTFSAGDAEVGQFYASCSVVDADNLHLQCSYELVDSSVVGVIVMSGPTIGMQYLWNIAGTAHGFSQYNGGTVQAIADASEPNLYVFAELTE